MPKTEVILTHNIVGLGAESDHVKVAAGYARNYLFPEGLAIPLTSANKRRIEALKQRRAEREAHELNSMSELARSLSKMTLKVVVKTGEDGKMFGSVTPGTIADELKHQFEIALDKKKIHLDHPIKTLGEHEIEMRLHADVHTTLKVIVESSTPPPAPVEAPAPAADARQREGGRFRDRDRDGGKARPEAGKTRPEGQKAKPESAKAPVGKHTERAPRKPRGSEPAKS
jgi:large subunit ribosomal protein L9